jgi:hypothetical protein
LLTEIRLPPHKAFIDGVLDGTITVLRMPRENAKAGDTVMVKTPEVDSGAIGIRIIHIEYPLLYAVTVEEAEREGYVPPDFCPSKTLCGSIESRTDFESLVFDQSGSVPVGRSREGFEQELYERMKAGCPSCLIKKDAKEFFLAYWRKTYQDMENREISKITFEVIAES